MRRRRDQYGLASNRAIGSLGFAASLIAVWCQVLLAVATISVPLARAADPLDSVPICHAEADGSGTPAPQKPGQTGHDCLLCIQCLSHASPLAILSAAPPLPEAQLTAPVLRDAYRPRAPPVRPVPAAQPRGPPSLI